MDTWRFLEEQHQDGLTFRYGLRQGDPAIYHMEPLAMVGSQSTAGHFRHTLATRHSCLSSCQNNGILQVWGPVSFQKRIWVGWQIPGHYRLFGKTPPSLDELPAILSDLYLWITSYRKAHQAGIIVGIPDYGRIFRTEYGFQMPDPWISSHLARSCRELPPGLSRILPPERYGGAPPDQAGDLFCLGVMLFWMITGELPFATTSGWPTAALLSGRVIPMSLFRPEIAPQFRQIVRQLLSPVPSLRPTAETVQTVWKEALASGRIWTTEAELRSRQTQNQYYLRTQYFREMMIRCRYVLIPCVGILLFWILGRLWQNRPSPPVSHVVREILQSDPATWSFRACGGTELYSVIRAESQLRALSIRQLATYPYLTVKSIRAVTSFPRKSILELSLEWWTWQNGAWQKKLRRAIVVAHKKRNQWKITEIRF